MQSQETRKRTTRGEKGELRERSEESSRTSYVKWEEISENGEKKVWGRSDNPRRVENAIRKPAVL